MTATVKHDPAALTEFVQTHLPIAQEMGITVEHYDGNSLTLVAPLDPNINDKGTAFGGSIYCVAVFTCWGMVYLKAREYGLQAPNVVVAKGEIDYLKPVNGVIRATCSLVDDSVFDEFWLHYQQRGKAKVDLTSQVQDDNGERLAHFSGKYAII
jgi:thioesterase domain-containing protein